MSAIGQVEVMKAIHPNISERELQGYTNLSLKIWCKACRLPLNCWGRCTWMCTSLYCKHCRSGGTQLVLMDVGAEFQNYTADVTRTIPANGKFTKEQAEIYNLVLAAQNAGIEASVVGASFSDPHRVARSIIQQGLIDLGIIESEKEVRTYFPHGTSHYIGLDVHDLAPMALFEPTLSLLLNLGFISSK